MALFRDCRALHGAALACAGSAAAAGGAWRVPESEVVHGGWVEKKLFHYIKGRQRTEASCYNGEGETDCAAISVRQYLTEKNVHLNEKEEDENERIWEREREKK